MDLHSSEEAGARDGERDASPAADIAIRVTPTDDRMNSEFAEVCVPILGSPEHGQHNVKEAQPHVRSFVADPAAVFDRLGVGQSTRRGLRSLLVG